MTLPHGILQSNLHGPWGETEQYQMPKFYFLCTILKRLIISKLGENSRSRTIHQTTT